MGVKMAGFSPDLFDDLPDDPENALLILEEHFREECDLAFRNEVNCHQSLFGRIGPGGPALRLVMFSDLANAHQRPSTGTPSDKHLY